MNHLPKKIYMKCQAFSQNKRANMALYHSPENQWDLWPLGGAIFYLRAVIWTSPLDTSKEVSSQLAFLFNSRGLIWRPSWIFNFQLFLIYKSPQYFLLSFESICLPIKKYFKLDFFKMATMATVLHFHQNNFSLFFIYKSPLYILPSFESIGLSGEEQNSFFKIAVIVAILDFW